MRRRYMSMNYVYPRSNGLLELRYPIPNELRSYFPKTSGNGNRVWIGGSLGTRDATSANVTARERIERYEKLFAVLRGDDTAEAVERFLRYAYEQELMVDEAERLDVLAGERNQERREDRLRANFKALR